MAQHEEYDPAKHNRDTPQETFGPVVKIDRHEDGRIYVITMNRPHRMNSLGGGMGGALVEAFEEFRDDPNARVAILTGAGNKAFSAGADLIETAERRQAAEGRSAPAQPSPGSRRGLAPLSEGLGLWKPTIAAVNGFAIAGGFMVAMQCDIRIMAEHARIGIAEVRWNMPGAGWMIPLTRQIGLGSALELALWGDTQYDAQRCYELGWAQRVVPGEQLMETAMSYAQRAVDMAPRAVRNNKQALYRGFYMDPLQGQAYGAALEQNLVGMRDSVEGPSAFSEKRRPNFTDS
jgi:enoyl-CoA hydratase/carnithine racemase